MSPLFRPEVGMKMSALHCSRRLGALTCAMLAARGASAQTITGKVRAKSDNAPVSGAIVALLDSAGHPLATKLAEDSGDFVFVAPSEGSYSFRVERVGYRSSTTAPFLVRHADTVDVPIMIVSEAVNLRTVRVSADRRCIVRPQEGLATAQLWAEARKALNATQLTQLAQAAAKVRRDPHRFAVRWRTFQRELDPTSLQPRHDDEVEREGETVTPFVSADAEMLARDGYVSGQIDTGSTFYAPDAAILLSDRFLDTHCFRVQAPERGRRDDLIGLAFEPTYLTSNGASNRVEVHGVLWLDRESAELRYLDYGYANLPFAADESRAGGRLEFRPLPDGRWIVWRWYIRTPRLERRRTFDNAPGTSQTVVAGVRESGAELLEVRPAGRSRQARGAVHGVAFDSLAGTPLAMDRIFLSGTTLASVTDSSGRYALGAVPPGIYSASILSPRFDSMLLDPPKREFSVSAGEDKEIDLAVPSFRTISALLCGTSVADSMSLIVGVVRDSDGGVALGTSVRAEWSTVASAGSNNLRQQSVSVEATTGPAGRYALCPVRSGVRFTLRARRGRTTAVSIQPSAHAGEVRRVDLVLGR